MSPHTPLNDDEAADRAHRVEALLERVESMTDPDARATVTELLQPLLELYGEGLSRIMAAAATVSGTALVDTLAADELVAHLLLLHGLHPSDTETRVREAVERAAPQLGGATAELVGVEGGVARVRLRGRGGCRSSAPAMRATLEEAIRDAAPEVARVEVEEAAPPPAVIPADSLLRGRTGARTS
ncbi:NifU family protein [Microtetraspora sp. AC03309]|uniref:NifU family protein n=1 Tax=Microtetraspora sp. AC03309 TaxID=2779376 RepID=UPI001E31CFD7|nr:NifU family protein [Microtetraspora sp. AC03309]MCC5579073.1 NifU family protein [Microtetraspora sp. AC03309]